MIHHYGPHRAPETPLAEPWVTQAACATVDPDLMFPTVGDKPAYRDARRICAACPVINECLEEALAIEGTASKANRYGVRAAMSPAERADLYTRRRRSQLEEAA
jgi:WhiB family redox-sensing transcriptional regulator